MIKFKQLKYKHVMEARSPLAQIEKGEADQGEMDAFVFPLVADWDFVDVETEQPIPIGQPGELSVEQYNAVIDSFNEQMAGDSIVKKNERLALTLWLDAVKSEKEKLPKGPEWLGEALFYLWLGKLPHKL